MQHRPRPLANRLLELPLGRGLVGACATRSPACEAPRRSLHYDVRRFDSPKFFVHYVVVGRGAYHCDGHPGQALPLGPGSCYQAMPGRIHSVDWSRHEHADWYLLGGSELLVPLRELGLLPLPEPVLQLAEGSAIPAAFRELYRSLSGDAPASRVLAELVRLLDAIHRARRSSERAAAPWIARACERLADGSRSIPEIAEEFAMSAEAFRQGFRAVTGVTPRSYRIRRRVERACELLDRHPIKQVAAHLGYPDLPSFSKQFRRYTGLTPRAFRDALPAGHEREATALTRPP